MNRWVGHGGKRVMDIVIAVPATIAALPLMALIALCIRLRLGAPVLFRQERNGRHGSVIMVPKFRTMDGRVDADGKPLPDSVRTPALGERLRRTSLDELPQLFSVIRGDMSLVGPRPLHARYLERYDQRQRRRLDARPGLTGWAEIRGGRTLEWSDRFELDLWYIDHASPWLDLSILAGTFRSVVHRNASTADSSTTPEFGIDQ